MPTRRATLPSLSSLALCTAAVTVLSSSLLGCGWWAERKAKKALEGVASDTRDAMEDMRKADGKVLKTRAKLSGKDSPKEIALRAFDYSMALQACVEPAGALSTAIAPLSSDEEIGKVVDRVRDAATTVRAKCDHKLKLDEIDPCGGAWGDMVRAADALTTRAHKLGVELPTVREDD
jgi:hypothetical protein